MSKAVTADKVKAENVDWLWRERVPRSMLTVFAGKPDGGKGLLAAHIAAEVTREGGNVLYSAIEDSNGLMTRPRLEAAGAVLKRVHLWNFMLPSQQRELADFVVDKEIDLVVIDPLAAHLTGVSRHSDNIREVTTPLKELAELTGAAVLIIEHVNKKVGPHSHPLSAIGGSGSGLPAACRMGYLFGTDPSDDDQKVLACVKSNVRDRPDALFFEVDEGELPALERTVPFLIGTGEGVFDPIRLVSTERTTGGKNGRPAEKRASAAEWLTKALKNGPVKRSKIIEDAKQAGMKSRTLRRAVEDMGIIRNPVGGGANCTYELPPEILEMLDDSVIANGDAKATPVTSDGSPVSTAALEELLGEGGE